MYSVTNRVTSVSKLRLGKLLFTGAMLLAAIILPFPASNSIANAKDQANSEKPHIYLPSIMLPVAMPDGMFPFPLREPEPPYFAVLPGEGADTNPFLIDDREEEGIEISDVQGTAYYVDCDAQDDSGDGESQETAWKSVNKANQATLNPGDRLFFKRGCIWTGQIQAKWQGTADAPIFISAYGTGDLPIIQDGDGNDIYDVKITGSYQIIEYLFARLTTRPNPEPNCMNQPVAWFAGFGFVQGAHHNIVRRSQASKLAVGIFFEVTSHHNKAFNNVLRDNDIVWVLRTDDTIGAMGVLLHGDSNVVAYNYFANNRAICTFTGAIESNSVELFQATNSVIHHNISYYDRVFSEIGSSSTVRSANNTFAYNLQVSDVADLVGNKGARFVVTRGWGDPYGPVLNTMIYNNTIYLVGGNSTGVSCLNCGNDILTMENNILFVNRTPFYTDAPFNESNNIFWNGDGKPNVYSLPTFSVSATSRTADPQFTDPTQNNFFPLSASPVVSAAASSVPGYTYKRDLAGTLVPSGTGPDIGAYER